MKGITTSHKSNSFLFLLGRLNPQAVLAAILGGTSRDRIEGVSHEIILMFTNRVSLALFELVCPLIVFLAICSTCLVS